MSQPQLWCSGSKVKLNDIKMIEIPAAREIKLLTGNRSRRLSSSRDGGEGGSRDDQSNWI